jgi:hypothetical protein
MPDTSSDPYWQQTLLCGQITLSPADQPRDVYLQLHTENEEYDDPIELDLKLSAQRGERIYIHCKPCVLVPRILLTVAFRQELLPVHSDLRADEEVHEMMIDPTGELIGSRVEGMDRQGIGQLQAWYYPADQLIVFWECDLFRGFYQTTSDDPSQDAVLTMLWERFEQHLWEVFDDARLMITPSWEPKYKQEAWEVFLRQRGYTPDQQLKRAFSKLRAD